MDRDQWAHGIYGGCFLLNGDVAKWWYFQSRIKCRWRQYTCVIYIVRGTCNNIYPDSWVQGANIGLIWCRQDTGGPHVGPMNFAIWVVSECMLWLPNKLWIRQIDVFSCAIYKWYSHQKTKLLWNFCSEYCSFVEFWLEIPKCLSY